MATNEDEAELINRNLRKLERREHFRAIRRAEVMEAKINHPTLAERPTFAPPKLVARTRRLSINSQTNLGTAVHSQTQSGFFKLPPEIRRLIYLLAFGESAFHICSDAQKLSHAKCLSVENGCRWCTLRRFRLAPLSPNWTSGRIKRYDDDCSDCNLIPLLQTCHRIYNESHDVLYRCSTFDFSLLDVFLWFGDRILPHHLGSISSIRLATAFYAKSHDAALSKELTDCSPFDQLTWERTWELVARMPGLTKIHLQVWYSDSMDAVSEEKALAPLRVIRHVRDFEVVLMWPGDYTCEMPYRITRTPPPPDEAFLGLNPVIYFSEYND
jgi:hypothetical protein